MRPIPKNTLKKHCFLFGSPINPPYIYTIKIRNTFFDVLRRNKAAKRVTTSNSCRIINRSELDRS